MEDSGYMARTAFIMDRLMSRVGLSGGFGGAAFEQFRMRYSRHHGGPDAR